MYNYVYIEMNIYIYIELYVKRYGNWPYIFMRFHGPNNRKILQYYI